MVATGLKLMPSVGGVTSHRCARVGDVLWHCRASSAGPFPCLERVSCSKHRGVADASGGTRTAAWRTVFCNDSYDNYAAVPTIREAIKCPLASALGLP